MALTEPDGKHHCHECATPHETLSAANECATIDRVEANQTRQAQRKRQRDHNIVRAYN